MKVSDVIEFKSKKIKELNLKKELTEQVCNWILEILHNIDISRVEFKEEDICIDEVGYFRSNTVHLTSHDRKLHWYSLFR